MSRIEAPGLAQAAGNRLLGAGILDSTSHQATYIGRFQEAANLAQARKPAGATGEGTVMARMAGAADGSCHRWS
jgi:hypothetical protein